MAEDQRLHRKVALKFLPPHARQDERARSRFQREARAVAALDHPNICALYEVGSSEGGDYLVMQYVEGETLAALIRRQRPASQDALQFALQIADPYYWAGFVVQGDWQ